MNLATYMDRDGIRDGEFATAVGRDRTTVMRWRTGKTRPDWEALAKIEEVTGGLVTATDFMAAPEPAQ